MTGAVSDPAVPPATYEMAFEAFGVRVGVGTNDAGLRSQLDGLPPSASRPCDANALEHHFSVTVGEGTRDVTVRYDLRDGVVARVVDIPSYVATDVDLDLALGLLETHLHSCIAFRTPDHVFIDAGVVVHRGRAIVMPGPALSGKTTLVEALMSAGALRYSDQFAVLDAQGRAQPYAMLRSSHEVDEGSEAKTGDSIPVGAVIATIYRPGAGWQPKRLSPGEGALALLSHAVAAQERPEHVMGVINRALESDPVMIASDRDEADAVAPHVLAELDRALDGPGAA